jgi:hypothetical protein
VFVIKLGGETECGDGFCEPGEDTCTCPDDCGGPTCGDGVCAPSAGEDCATCLADCACPPAHTCEGGACVSGCPPPKQLICHVPPGNPDNEHDLCVGTPAVPAHLAHGDRSGSCGDGSVGPPCGDGVCDPEVGENCSTCPDDCRPAPGAGADGSADDAESSGAPGAAVLAPAPTAGCSVGTTPSGLDVLAAWAAWLATRRRRPMR